METNNLSEGTKGRLVRIQELRKCTEQEALDYAISTAWLVAEHKDTKRRLKLPENVVLQMKKPD